MALFSITPYVRFARIQKKPLYPFPVFGQDHRIFYCASGEGEITVNDRAYLLSPNTFLFIRSGNSYFNSSKSDTSLIYAFNFDFWGKPENMGGPITFLKDFEYSPDVLIEPDLSLLNIPDVFSIKHFFKADLLLEIINEYNRQEPYYQERCSTLLKDIILCALRSHYKETVPDIYNKGSEILSYIREHYNEDITNSSVARHFSYHTNYVNQMLKQQTGHTLHHYLLNFRIKMAISFMQSGEYTVSEVSELVGFTTPAQFSKCFKQITGATPSTYLPH